MKTKSMFITLILGTMAFAAFSGCESERRTVTTTTEETSVTPATTAVAPAATTETRTVRAY